MEKRKGFYDLCVPYKKNEVDLIATLNELHDVGYRTIAIDQIFDHTKCSRKSNEIFPEPIDVSSLRQKFHQKLQILSRLTILYSQQVITHDMNTSLNVKKFNLICGVPTTESALQHACSTFGGDLIGLVHEDMKVCLISHKFYQMAARRGIYFEIQYASAIRNSNQRKDIIVIAQNLVAHRKAKSIVISGGAINSFEVRSPYDVANLGLIFGLSEEQSKSAISHVCRSVLLKAEGRRYGKTVIFTRNIESVKDDNDDATDSNDNNSKSDESMDEGHPPKKQKTF